MDHNSGNYPQPWAAVLGHPMTPDPSYGLPMDLHISQGFSYYSRWFSIQDALIFVGNRKFGQIDLFKREKYGNSREVKENQAKEFFECTEIWKLMGCFQINTREVGQTQKEYAWDPIKFQDFNFILCIFRENSV